MQNSSSNKILVKTLASLRNLIKLSKLGVLIGLIGAAWNLIFWALSGTEQFGWLFLACLGSAWLSNVAYKWALSEWLALCPCRACVARRKGESGRA